MGRPELLAHLIMPEPIRALLIEGHPAVMRALSRRLQAELILVGAADDPDKALDRVATTHPQVVLLGLQQTHRRQAAQIAQLICQLHETGVAVVVLVGYADEIENELFRQAGADRYLLKYINTQRLLAEIRSAVSRAT